MLRAPQDLDCAFLQRAIRKPRTSAASGAGPVGQTTSVGFVLPHCVGEQELVHEVHRHRGRSRERLIGIVARRAGKAT